MNIQLAKRMQELKASEIREILKVTQQRDMISFAGGLPAAEMFPVAELQEATQEVLRREGSRALQYSTTEGFVNLRWALAVRMNAKRGTCVDTDAILISSGSQQGLDLTGKLFLDEGDAVLCESPTYLGAINAFRVFRPRFVEVPTDDDGMIISELTRLLKKEERIKFIYVVPDFQNPSGRCWSLQRRREFMEIVQRHGMPVIEDAPYSELYFEATNLPALKSFDTRDLVVYLGTFSKILCPGLRLAWLAAAPELIRQYVLLKQGTDLHTSTLAQLQARYLLMRYDLEAHIRRIRSVYRQRRDVMLAAMDRTFPDEVRYTRPGGGMFLWVELPAWANAREVLTRSLEQKVAFVPGGSSFPNGGHENTFRLNFSAMPPERIVEGIERLAKVLRRYLAAKPAITRDAVSQGQVCAHPA
jgi:DNA-binding transcriptional MocR family regulator